MNTQKILEDVNYVEDVNEEPDWVDNNVEEPEEKAIDFYEGAEKDNIDDIEF